MIVIKRFMFVVLLLAGIALPGYVSAHEGHPHKIMGTVSARHGNQVDVAATDGKTATVALNDKTRILRGKSSATPDDIKPGLRIVVTATETKGADGKTTMIASEVRMPEAPTK
jgi:hypothetical protein